MRPSAKHMLLVSTLIPAFLLLGCNAPTGLDQPGDPAVANEGRDVTGQSVAPKPAQDELCYQYRGEWVCESEEDTRFPR
jgi:hypothetical protein